MEKLSKDAIIKRVYDVGVLSVVTMYGTLFIVKQYKDKEVYSRKGLCITVQEFKRLRDIGRLFGIYNKFYSVFGPVQIEVKKC